MADSEMMGRSAWYSWRWGVVLSCGLSWLAVPLTSRAAPPPAQPTPKVPADGAQPSSPPPPPTPPPPPVAVPTAADPLLDQGEPAPGESPVAPAPIAPAGPTLTLPTEALTAPAKNELDLFRLDSLLNSVVVTASRGQEEERSSAAASVFTISREDIQQHGWRSITEALGNVPGLYLIDDLVTPSVGVRGVTGGLQAGSRLVKVMINGVAINFRPELTALLGQEFLPIDAVERIEVAKGPLSALYGANAFIATINVITRRGRAGTSAELTLHSGAVNGNGAIGGSGLLSYRGANLWILAAFSGARIDRSGLVLQQTFDSPFVDPAEYGRASSNDLALPLSGYLQIGATSERLGTLVLEGGVQRLDANGEFRLNSLLTGRSRVQLLNLWSNLRYDQHWSKVDFSASASYSRGTPDRDYQLSLTGNNSYSFRPNYDYHDFMAQTSVTYSPFGARLSIKANLEFDFAREGVLYYTQTFNRPEGVRLPGDAVDLIADSTPRTQDYFNVGAALQITSAPFRRLPKLLFSGNLRIDKITFGPADYDPLYSWRLAASYRVNPRTVVKLVAGRAFQTPSGTLLFGQGQFGTANNVIGNLTLQGLPLLRPQTVTSVELLASTVLFRHLALEGGVFGQFLDDKIEFIQTGGDFVAANRDVQNSVGFEAAARLSFGRFSSYGWASFLWNLGSDPNPPDQYPNIFGLIGVDLDVKEAYVHANAQVRIVGPRGPSQSNLTLNNNVAYPIPTYGAVDITLSSVGLHPFGRNTETRILLSVRNITVGTRFEPGFGGFDFPNIRESYHIQLQQTF